MPDPACSNPAAPDAAGPDAAGPDPAGPDPAGPDQAVPAPGLYGIIRIDVLRVAIPIAAVREAVPCPAVLAPFSASRPDVVGAIELRGQLVPVIDLGIALGLQTLPPRTTAPIIVILRHAGHVHGFLAEGIDGVRSLTREMLGPITHAGLAPPTDPKASAMFWAAASVAETMSSRLWRNCS